MKNLILFFFVIITLSVNSQGFMNEGVMASRYWNYRYALRGDAIDPSFPRWEPGFVEVGTGQGFSLPIAERLRFKSVNSSGAVLGTPMNNWDWEISTHIPQSRRGGTVGTRNGSLNWGDGPQDLARYLIMLSTELQLLTLEAYKYGTPISSSSWVSNNAGTAIWGKQPRSLNINDIITNNINLYNQLLMTYDELDNALSAAERLDYFAETTYGLSPSSNGFLVRDDVPSNFNDDCKFGCAEILDPNYLTNTTGVYYGGHSFYSTLSVHTNSTELGLGGSTNLNQCPLSQDLVNRLLLGLAYSKSFSLLHKLLIGDPKDILNRSEALFDRMLWYSFPNYNLDNPNGSSVSPGPSLLWASGPLYSAYQRYGNGNTNVMASFISNTVGEPMWVGQKTAYTAEWITGQLAWVGSVLGLPIFLGPYHQHELFGFVSALDDRNPMFLNGSLKLFGKEVATNGGNELDYNINHLMESLRFRLHGGSRYVNLTDYKEFLNKWNFECEHDTRNYVPATSPGIAFKERNGLDFMIMYNLYKLDYGENARHIDMSVNQLSSYVPLYNRSIVGVFPKTIPYNFTNANWNTWPPSSSSGSVNITYGNDANPANIQAANFLDLRNLILLPEANIQVRAPHMDIFPGCDAQFGCVLDIRPNDRMECLPYTTNTSGSNVIYSKMSGYLGIQKIGKSASIFPNPTENNTTLKLTNYDKTNVNIAIYNMIGREMHRFSNIEITDDEQNYNMNLESLSTGIYIVKVEQGDYKTSLKLEKR